MIAIEKRAQIQRQLSAAEAQNAEIEAGLKALETQFEELITAQQEDEAELLDKFAFFLNEKKRNFLGLSALAGM